MRAAVIAFGALLAACSKKPSSSSGSEYVGAKACGECHADRWRGFQNTSHHLASVLASPDAVRGRFDPPNDVLLTRNPELSFRMEERDGAFFVNVIAPDDVLRLRIDYVVGVGLLGQSYLYWDGDKLLQAPVGWFRPLARWANNPGHKDGVPTVKPILPRCLECHATYAEVLEPNTPRFKKESLMLGISCERCHGPGAPHVAFHRAHPGEKQGREIVHPGELERDREVDLCAQCHAGAGEPQRPAFTFRPGQRFADFVRTKAELNGHASNQVAALRASKCFQASPKMTCTTCHDPHQPPPKEPERACLDCHPLTPHAQITDLTALRARCIDCHLPRREDPNLGVEFPGGIVHASSRDHQIRVVR